ncbi:hypothetical protein SAMN04487965_1413 [Microbulbifer donghaiensis]|uniref:Uncharacterized protein n=1 Tax=Microbulbifer donghaiensis TaxID=494016 RepID=A0A1M4Z1M4_9GAMM|nr:hypothetical protein [Microbulbifer donghaiensis]SHF11969.1 hypothetical protein SAMN04487965_1413 [Microbulbifer donghaiensis]
MDEDEKRLFVDCNGKAGLTCHAGVVIVGQLFLILMTIFALDICGHKRKKLKILGLRYQWSQPVT